MFKIRDILLYFSYKYKGDWQGIFTALQNKENVDEKEIDDIVKKVGNNYITILDEDYAENMLFKEQMLYMETPQNIDFLKDVLLFHDKEVGKRNVRK